MIPAIRGTRDILPGEVERWQRLERVARDVCRRYGYQEIRTPLIEREELFAKGTGQATDIVQKEMYTFADKGGERVTLRPEATPSIVRAFVQHSLEQSMPVAKLYSLGPMFRYERPQKGRYRQFHQFDVETFGIPGPALDAEMIEMAATFLANLGIEQATLLINSVGCDDCRPTFTKALLDALGDRVPKLCQDCQRRARTNPLRIFDCKVPRDQAVIDSLPHTVDFLCVPCREHFEAVQQSLSAYQLNAPISHRLVRGLDYYTRTTFEIIGNNLGAQDALLGGGRYDGLVKTLGGSDRAGIGYAAGMERLVMSMPDDDHSPVRIDAFVVSIGHDAHVPVQLLAGDLRRAGLSVLFDYEKRSPRAQMKRADKSGAAHVLIVGSDELVRGEVSVKNMATSEQAVVPRDDLVAYLRDAQKD